MDFGLLGPLQVLDEGVEVDIAGEKRRTLLATLLLDAGQPVSTDRLVAACWGEEAPPAATSALHNHIMSVRRALRDADGSRLRRSGTGYVIRTEPGRFDVNSFTRHLHLGREAYQCSAWNVASQEFVAGLDLWRGEALDGLPARPHFGQAAAELSEQRWQAWHGRIESDLHLGRHLEVVGELIRLTSRHPLREEFHSQLMLAHYRAGRQSEALQVFQRLRRTLVDELGVEPASDIQALHRRILAQAPDLAAPRPQIGLATGGVAHHAGTPAQLPRDMLDFTGRDGEAAALVDAVKAGSADVAQVALIDGMAGIGKTAFATHLAHRLAEDYRDGQFYVNLHGHTPGLAPAEPAEVLRTLLSSIGVPGRHLPDDPDARAALWRSELSSRRTIIVLDNAAGADQVRPLIPGGAGSLALVTSRSRLWLDGAHILTLDLLPEAEALELFRRIVGGRSFAEPTQTAEIIRMCGGLPLAIRLAAARLQARPAWTVAHLAARLADHEHPLTELTSPDRGIAATFSVSYRQLTVGQRTLFRLLGLHPGAEFDTDAVAALARIGAREAEQLLEQLLDAHLVQQYTAGRYTLHDLLRQYARLTALENDDEGVRRAAVTRLFDHYRYAANEAVDQVIPHPPQRRPRIDAPESPKTFAGPEQARAWLEAELPNLLAIGAHCAMDDWPPYTCDLSDILWRYLTTHGRLQDAVTLHSHAVQAARRLGDIPRQAQALRGLGNAYHMLSRYDDARHAYLDALKLCGTVGDEIGEARIWNNLGSLAWRVGDLEQALEHLRRALARYRSIGDAGEANAVNNLGGVSFRLGRYRDAVEYFGQAFALYSAAGNRSGQCDALIGLAAAYGRTGHDEQALEYLQQGLILAGRHDLVISEAGLHETLGALYARTGRHDDATRHLHQSLELSRKVGNKTGQAWAMTELGIAHQRQGNTDQAFEWLHQGLSLSRDLGDRGIEVEALLGLGAALRTTGRPDQALDQYTAALDLARAAGYRYEQARAHRGLSLANEDLGRPESAHQHGAKADALFAELGVPMSAEEL